MVMQCIIFTVSYILKKENPKENASTPTDVDPEHCLNDVDLERNYNPNPKNGCDVNVNREIGVNADRVSIYLFHFRLICPSQKFSE